MQLPPDMLDYVFSFSQLGDAFNLAHAASHLLVASNRDPRVKRTRRIFTLVAQVPNTLLWGETEETAALENYKETAAMVDSVTREELLLIRRRLQDAGVGWMSYGFCVSIETGNQPVASWFANLQDYPMYVVGGNKVSFPTYERWVFNQYKGSLSLDTERMIQGSVHSKYRHFMRLIAGISANNKSMVATALRDGGFLTNNNTPENFSTKLSDIVRHVVPNCKTEIVVLLASRSDDLRKTLLLGAKTHNKTELIKALEELPYRRS